MYPQVKSGEIDMNQYSLSYTVDPKASYVIQPREGEINYDIAFKNPNKFFEKVMDQEVTEHKVEAKKKVVQERLPTGELSPKKIKSKGLKTDHSTHKRGSTFKPTQPKYYVQEK